MIGGQHQEYEVGFEFNGFLHHGYKLLCPVPGATRVRVKSQRCVSYIYSIGCPHHPAILSR